MQLRSEVTRRPVGSVALLFTDIEGSTGLARALGGEWPSVLEQHYELLRRAILGNGGYIDHATGDGVFALFEDSVFAVRAAVSAQRALARHPWPPAVGELRVRMGLHRGVVEDGDHGYTGLDVHLAARVEAAAHGGQIVVTAAMRDAVGDAVPTETLGEHRLKDFPAPERLFHVVVDGRGASDFPPLRTAQVRPTNLPVELRPLVGRKREIRDLRAALLQDGLFAITDDLCAETGISGTLTPERDERLARLRIDAMDAIGESEAVAAGERGRGLRPAERIARITALASSAGAQQAVG